MRGREREREGGGGREKLKAKAESIKLCHVIVHYHGANYLFAVNF